MRGGRDEEMTGSKESGFKGKKEEERNKKGLESRFMGSILVPGEEGEDSYCISHK